MLLDPVVFPVFIAIVAIVILAIFFHFVPFFLWLSAKVSGVHISLIQLFLMRIRNVPPGVIVPSLIEAHKAGLKNITRDNLEAHYMTGGHVQRVVHALVSASKANIDLPFEKATAIDLAGRDVFEAVQTSVNPKVLRQQRAARAGFRSRDNAHHDGAGGPGGPGAGQDHPRGGGRRLLAVRDEGPPLRLRRQPLRAAGRGPRGDAAGGGAYLGAGYFHRSTEPDRNDDHAVGQHFVEQKRRRKSAGTIAGKQRKPDAAGIAGSRTGRSRSGTDDGLCKIDVPDPAAAIGRFRRTFYEFIPKKVSNRAC